MIAWRLPWKEGVRGIFHPMEAPTPPPSSAVRRWVETWREAGKALSQVKRAELERLETSAALVQLADAFELALRTSPATRTSGLVEQQAIFSRLVG